MPHMISETARMVKEYNDTRKYAVELYTDVFSLSPESRERMASARNQKIDQIKDRLKTYKPASDGRTDTYSADGQKVSNAPTHRGQIEFYA
ncbi:hypothetical protein LEP1GSC060_0091 [Leptospira weilii serovar Ranarum str. ICFT]|uniref:Uncharacterized protein n=2 Tax=Leptospira weilii TaxID=28184 RepID=N1WJB7_9LEPT|nr:hypothetical protein LEP1GSC060_0091 [Leptospira weilii serovar Ranarum str. ICFT]